MTLVDQGNDANAANDINVSPLAFDDSYNSVGNTTLTVSAANGVLGGAVLNVHETARGGHRVPQPVDRRRRQRHQGGRRHVRHDAGRLGDHRRRRQLHLHAARSASKAPAPMPTPSPIRCATPASTATSPATPTTSPAPARCRSTSGRWSGSSTTTPAPAPGNGTPGRSLQLDRRLQRRQRRRGQPLRRPAT